MHAPAPDLSRHEATETLYVQHHRWLANWLRRRMHGDDQAADLAQDTFLKLLDARETPALREPRAFLATLARRVLANHYRRQAIEEVYLDSLASQPDLHAPSPETRALVLEALCQIDQALDGLPAPVRRAFLLAQLEGLGYAEIACQLGVTTRTVGNYMARAAAQCFFALEA